MEIMNLLDKFDYMKFSIIISDFKEVQEFLLDNFHEDIKKNRFHLYSNEKRIESLVTREPFLGKKRVVVIFSPVSNLGLTVFWSNLQDGWYTLINKINNKLECSIFRIGLSSDNVKYPFSMLELYENGCSKRFVRNMLDGKKWEFFQEGEILPFENRDNYNKKKISSRFDRKLLLEYLTALGFDLFDEKFWIADKCAAYYMGKRIE